LQQVCLLLQHGGLDHCRHQIGSQAQSGCLQLQSLVFFGSLQASTWRRLPPNRSGA
jgi:hypothetical protein